MELLKLEFIAFVEKNFSPSTAEFPALMTAFSKYELLPQFVQETDLRTSISSKVVSFSNNFNGLSITFNSDRIHISRDISNGKAEDVKSSVDNFIEFSKECLDAIYTPFYNNIKFKRLSILVTGLEKTNKSKKTSLIDSICSNITGRNNAMELKFRVSHQEKSKHTDEIINISTMINDGIFEETNIAKNITSRFDCFLLQWDLNTIEENSIPRFDANYACVVIDEYHKLLEEQIENTVKHF